MRDRIPILGFVGGIGSGKSAVAAWLAERLHVTRLDADALGHAALRQPDIKQRLRELFGAEVFGPDGEIVRSRLAERVFGPTPAHAAARRMLETVVHPVIREQLKSGIDAARADAASGGLILLDAAVMLESGWSDLCDLIVFVDTPWDIRVARVARCRGWSAEELARREASQWSLDRKRAAADLVLDNSGHLDETGQALLAQLLARFPELASCLPAEATPAAAAGELHSTPPA